jgi:hypothetical protein
MSKRWRNLVEEFAKFSIDVNELLHTGALHRENTVSFRVIEFRYPWLSGLRADRYAVQLQLSQGAPWIRVSLQWTGTPFRSRSGTVWRPWFLCPKCRRRAGRLYNGGDFIACRICCGLRYAATSHQSPRARRHHQAMKIRLKLGGKARLSDPIPQRPFGMHRSTYRRLRTRLELIEHDLRTCRRRRFWERKKPEYALMIPPR